MEDIDTVMKLGMNHPMGPLTLADFIGLTRLAIMEVLHNGFGDTKYRPCPSEKMVAAGYLGKKSGTWLLPRTKNKENLDFAVPPCLEESGRQIFGAIFSDNAHLIVLPRCKMGFPQRTSCLCDFCLEPHPRRA